MDNFNETRKRIFSVFKLSGFSMKSDLCTFLTNYLQNKSNLEKEELLTKIIKSIQSQQLYSTYIEQKHIEIALKDLENEGLNEDETIFSVINAFDVPRYNYNSERKLFELYNGKRTLLSSVQEKTNYMINRYTMLYQKTMRHELFSPIIAGTKTNIKKFNLLYIENLLAESKINEVVVLGLLTQLQEGKFFLEDPTGSVPIDLSNTRFHAGFICEGCFVLAEGKYSDGVLKVSGLGHPPSEPAKSSRAFFNSENTWGGQSKKLLKYSERLLQIESTNSEATIIFLADVRLDEPKVLEKLGLLFVGYDECPPIAIILMGPFAKPDTDIYKLKTLFKELGNLTTTCERLREETKLVLIPALDDPTAPSILPRLPLPKVLISDLEKKWPQTILATNPCRIQYCTQQIVVCRADIVTKLCRNAIHFPETTELDENIARTIICQGSLAPFIPNTLPVYWDFDDAMSLYPLPDLVVIGDGSQAFTTSQLGCTIFNTGSFIKSKFSFKVYVPSTKILEDSELPDGENNDS